MKIVINKCFGSFGLSKAARNFMRLRDSECDAFIPRNDPKLVQAVEILKEKANDSFAELKVVNIPDDVKHWNIQEYNGKEWVAEAHRTWQ